MKNKGITFRQFKKRVLSNPEVRKHYDKMEPEYQIARQVIEARLKQNLTQGELAKKIGTGQAAISRLERMGAKPSVSFLERLARALDTKISLVLRP